MAHYTLHVDGMRCAGCENIIETNVKEVRGVQTVDADYKADTVEVTADGGSRAEVEEAINGLNYEVSE